MMIDKNLETKECRELCGIFYSVFDDSLGRINFAQYPNFFPKEHFDQVANFVITKEDLSNRVIVSKVDGKCVIGCLQSLENSKYPRNKFLFNICFVVNEEVSDNLISYENLVRNVNRFFHSLEQETGKLHHTESETMTACLEKIFCSLKQTGMCKYTWEGFGTIYLRMGAETEQSVVVESEQVPVLNLNFDRRLLPLDLTCQRLLPLLDGDSRVWDIAQRSAVDLKVVKACVQNLGSIGAVKTVSPFRSSARYSCMPALRMAWRDSSMKQRLVEYCLEDKTENLDKERVDFIADSALRGLAVLGPKTKVSDCASALESMNCGVKCKHLIQFAEMERLVRRVHGHPLQLGDGSSNRGFCVPAADLFDGTHNLEEIACLLNVPYDHLIGELDKCDDIFVIWN